MVGPQHTRVLLRGRFGTDTLERVPTVSFACEKIRFENSTWFDHLSRLGSGEKNMAKSRSAGSPGDRANGRERVKSDLIRPIGSTPLPPRGGVKVKS